MTGAQAGVVQDGIYFIPLELQSKLAHTVPVKGQFRILMT